MIGSFFDFLQNQEVGQPKTQHIIIFLLYVASLIYFQHRLSYSMCFCIC